VKWNQIQQGDCVTGLDRMDAGSVDLAFADPPFNIGYEYDVYDDRCKADQYLDWTRLWGQAVHRVLKPHGTFWLAIGDEFAAELKLIFQKELGFTCRSWVVWYYTFGVNCTKKFSRSHVHLFHFVKNAKKFKFNSKDPAIRVPSARQTVYNDSRQNPDGKLPDDTWILRPQDLQDGFQPDEDTWFFSRVCGTFKERRGWHGCQMPEQLLGRIIRACSDPGDLVLDPFGGSGTTLVVAKKLKRQFLGFELSKNYVARIQERLDAVEPGQPLEGAEDPKASAPPTPRRRATTDSPTRDALVVQPRDADGLKRGIIEAFFAARDGFSADRVIADPELNDLFLQSCRRLGLPGIASSWNLQLMNLRKAGQFAGLPRSRTTTVSREDIDRYSYACEIALQHLTAEAKTLDRVLCDPEDAAKLDDYVRSMIAGELSSFKIRWVALSIRKRAARTQELGRSLSLAQPRPRNGNLVTALDWNEIPSSPGLYWLSSPDQRLYVGETLDLQYRFRLQFNAPQFEFWGADRRSLEVRYRKMDDVANSLLWGNQSHWIARWKPVGNFAELAAL
jgi:DNA modification methylase